MPRAEWFQLADLDRTGGLSAAECADFAASQNISALLSSARPLVIHAVKRCRLPCIHLRCISLVLSTRALSDTNQALPEQPGQNEMPSTYSCLDRCISLVPRPLEAAGSAGAHRGRGHTHRDGMQVD